MGWRRFAVYRSPVGLWCVPIGTEVIQVYLVYGCYYGRINLYISQRGKFCTGSHISGRRIFLKRLNRFIANLYESMKAKVVDVP